MDEKVNIEFTKEEFNKIVLYMDSGNFETAQDAIVDAVTKETSGAWEFVFHNPSYSSFDDGPDSLYKCTNCGYTTGSTTKYCPVCGSKNQP